MSPNPYRKYFMVHKTDNLRIKKIQAVDSPEMVRNQYPLTEQAAQLVESTRSAIQNILNFKDDRLLVIVGPCSIHDSTAALEYAKRLSQLAKLLADDLLIVMRVYFEKPRTRLGWKGMINDPDLDSSFNINKGLRLARQLLLEINNSGMPAGTEFLDIVTGQYFSDLISWGAIGARTSESQVHRELASGLSCPVGFKNATDGNLAVACDAMYAAREAHLFLSPTQEGRTAIFTTSGNPDTHIILRGGKQPNYESQFVLAAIDELVRRKLPARIMIDLSHANSHKQYMKQLEVGDNVADQISNGQRSIVGVMIESHLQAGKQTISSDKPLRYGQSITDGCLAFDDTVPLLQLLSRAVQQRRESD